jgi:hypothetical protein
MVTMSRPAQLELGDVVKELLDLFGACKALSGNTNWRGHDVMLTRSFRGSGEPVWVSAL